MHLDALPKPVPSLLRGDRVEGRRCQAGVALGALALAVTACGPASEPGPGWRPPADAPPANVLLITVDTLRADHLGHHGYPRATSPFLDRLAAESVVFTQALAQVPKTVPSVASILTARDPGGTGVRSNHHDLPARALTLAEVLDRAGYATVGYTTNANLIVERGFAQGFDEFRYLPPPRDARVVTDAALERFEEGFAGPWLVWLHYIDPHGPYTPPEPYASMFLDDEHYDAERRVPIDYDPEPGRNENYVLGAAPRYQSRPFRDHPRATEVDFYRARYDGEIRYLDDQLARLFAHLRETGRLERTVVALVADHGEAMGERDYYFEHGWFVYQDQVHVPLMIRLPRGPRGVRVEGPVGLVGLASSLLAAAGHPVPQGFAAPDLLRFAARSEETRTIFSSTPTEEYPSTQRSARSGRWKYVVGDGREELYDLRRDPEERRDLSAEEREQLERLRRSLAGCGWCFAEGGAGELRREELPEEVVRDLEALGYLDVER